MEEITASSNMGEEEEQQQLNGVDDDEFMEMEGEEEQQQQQQHNGVGVDDDGTSSGRDGLLYTLVQRLQVYRPMLVLRKPLVRSYLSRQQNYLTITHAEYDRCFRRPGLLTDEEHGRVHGKGGPLLQALDRRGRSKRGLPLQALDRRGRSKRGLPLQALDRRGLKYDMVLVGLPKNCRLRTGWGEFLRNAGVRQDDDKHVGDVVEVWAFRSTAWDTELGLVLLHYTKEEEAQLTMEMSSTGRHHHQVQQQFALPSIVTEEEDDEEAMIVSAALTLVSMKRN